MKFPFAKITAGLAILAALIVPFIPGTPKAPEQFWVLVGAASTYLFTRQNGGTNGANRNPG